MTLQEWQATGRYFLFEGKYQIFYQQAGTGEPLLLLHGFPTASWDWHKIWPDLTKRFQVIAFDFLGFGFSDKPRRHTYHINDQADIAEALLRQLNITDYHLLAHDYGDTVAQELLARHQDRKGANIRSVALLNGGLFPSQHRPRPIQSALASPLGFLLTPFLNRNKLEKNFGDVFGPDTQATPQEIDEFYSLTQHNQGRYIFHRLIRYMPQRRQNEARWVRTLTQEKDLPICLINGTFDPVSGGHAADYYELHVPNPKVYRLENIGHYPQTEAPQAVVAALEDFWKDRKENH